MGRILMTALVGIALCGGVARAAELDAPAVKQYRAKPTSVRLIVMAGVSGAEGGFTIEWMPKSTFDALGDWPAAGDPAIVRGEFTGVPVWVTEGNSGDYTLPPTKWQLLELGELFDESGVIASSTAELEPGTDYALRVTANGGGANTQSLPSPTLFVTTSIKLQNCTYTQGYWKNHTSAWPVTSLKLGTVTYSAAQLLAIFNQPAKGNGLLILAHQLIAAKLNIANGADASTASATIASADAMIGSLVVPPVGAGFLSPSSVNATSTTLDNFNNGIIGPGHCGTTAAKISTWGLIKATYRR